jgi:hypothetical protein
MKIEAIEKNGKQVAEITVRGKDNKDKKVVIDFEPIRYIIVEKPTKTERSALISPTGLITQTEFNTPYDMNKGVRIVAMPSHIKGLEIGDSVFFLADKKAFLTKVSHVDTENDLVGSEDIFITIEIGGIELAMIDYSQIIGKVNDTELNYNKFYVEMQAK